MYTHTYYTTAVNRKGSDTKKQKKKKKLRTRADVSGESGTAILLFYLFCIFVYRIFFVFFTYFLRHRPNPRFQLHSTAAATEILLFLPE